jgi:hypothetical protein
MSEPENLHGAGSSPSPADRRAWVRYASNLEVVCRGAGTLKDAGWPAKVVNISRGGIGLLLRHRFEPGMPLAVEFLSHSSGARRTVLVKVAHATAVQLQPEPHWLVGCAFSEILSEAELQALLGERRKEI